MTQDASAASAHAEVDAALSNARETMVEAAVDAVKAAEASAAALALNGALVECAISRTKWGRSSPRSSRTS